MPEKSCSDEEFASLFTRYGARDTAKKLNVLERTVYARRRRLEHLFGGVLLFGVAAAMLSLALFRFSQEIRVALRELEKY